MNLDVSAIQTQLQAKEKDWKYRCGDLQQRNEDLMKENQNLHEEIENLN